MPRTNSDIEIRSEEVQEILNAVPSWMIRWGNTIIFIFIFIVLAISWFIKYPDIIPSEAMITTQEPPQKEYAKTTGKIDTLLVTDGQKVKEGTPLAIIENTANYTSVFLLKSIIDTIVINNDAFEFPLEKLPVLFLGEIESDYALFENSYLQYQLNKQLQPFSNEALANRISLSELNTRLQTLQAQRRINESELKFQKNDLERHKELHEKGVISMQEYEAKQLSYLQAERNFANIDASISQLRDAINNANKTSTSTTINKTKEEISLLKNVIQSFNQLKRAVRDWELRYVLSSDIDGTVSFLNIWNENQRVSQGDLVFTIIPETNAAYIAKLRSPSQNSGKIKIGQTVNIKLENYPDAEFGTLKGMVKNISLVPDKEGFYLIDVSLPEKLITSYNKEIAFKQEMRGAAEIITEDLRLIERLFYQFKEIFKR
ncbi:HlyD family secretion protein [Leptobacterium sp. I13]|uniref:HlyD family secretion protein n=1 Tax=Leptobacterium meishanense TaxID=3128904 RepID=UPI0030ED2783